MDFSNQSSVRAAHCVAHTSPSIQPFSETTVKENVVASLLNTPQVISESTSIGSVIRRLLHSGRKWRSVDLENQAWYTDPIDFLWPRSPSLSQRLYKRQSSLPDVSCMNLSKIFEESESEHDEGFYGVGEEHQSAALNVIAMLFGTDAKEEWSLPKITYEEEDTEQSKSPDPVVQREVVDNNNEKEEQLRTFSISTDDSSREQLYELLTGCKNCSQLQKRADVKFGASQSVNSGLVARPRDPVGAAWKAPEPPGRHPLYRRRSSGRIGDGGADETNAPCIPANTENQVLDDRPRSCDLSVDQLFHTGPLPTAGGCATAQEPEASELGNFSLEQSSIVSSSSSTSSAYHLFHSHSNPYSLPNNVTSSVHSNSTGSCLNSINSDYSVFSTQTLPVVVVASGRDLDLHSGTTEPDDDSSLAKATFHWTLDDSSCQEDAGEALVSPPDRECGGSATEHEDDQRVHSRARKKLVFSEEAAEEVQASSSPLLAGRSGADDSVDSLVSPLMLRLCLGGEDHVRGPSLSSDDGDAGEQPLVAADPHIDSAELRFNLDFILDNSTDEEEPDVESSDASHEANPTFLNEATSSDLEQDVDVFEDLAEDLQLNLDFINEEEDHLSVTSVEDLFNPSDAVKDSVASAESTVATELVCQGLGANSVQSSVCDTLANCVDSSESDWDTSRELLDSLASNGSLLCFLQGDFGISSGVWSSVLESVTGQHSPHQEYETGGSFACFPFENSHNGAFHAGSLLLSPGNPWGSVWLPISPRREEEEYSRPTSRLWDVNLQSPREGCATIENIQHYLRNLRYRCCRV